MREVLRRWREYDGRCMVVMREEPCCCCGALCDETARWTLYCWRNVSRIRWALYGRCEVHEVP